jgi:hypothetical protein
MVAPKVFISHAGKTDEEIEVLWGLHDRLGAEGFEVLLDIARLKEDLGGPWRATLNTWIEVCDSAILVFNGRAQSGSDWVVYESALLAWRRQRDPDFVLIPLIIPPALASDLSKGRFEPHKIGEQQAISTESSNYLDQIVVALAPVLERLRNTSSIAAPAALVEDRLTTLLYDVKDDSAVIRAAAKLGVDLTRWQPKLDRRRALARLLLQADLLEACRAAKELSNLEQHQLVRIREYLAPGWVSCQAADLIKPTALGPSSERLLALNAREGDTFEMYLHRATGESGERSWLCHREKPLTSRAASEILYSIREGFRIRLGYSAERLERRLNDPTKDIPVFVLLLGEEPEKSQLDLMHSDLQAVTFLVTTQEEDATEGKTVRSGARLLLPLLAPGAEDAALERYDDACEEIRNS